MTEMIHCQSCGMPLENQEMLGTNQDGSLNQEYCSYCYQNGSYTKDISMQEMIEISLKHMKESGVLEAHKMSDEEALSFMNGFFPELKRWKQSV